MLLTRFLNTPLIIEGKYLTNQTYKVMSYDEEYLMQRYSPIVTQNGGDILNVGFGLGLIDGHIRNSNPTSHTIIEIHPDVYQLAVSQGYEDNIILGDWRDVVPQFVEQGKKFDSIYFDTYPLADRPDEWVDFANVVDSILKPGGIYSYFGAVEYPQIEEKMVNLGYTMNQIIITLEELKSNIDDFDHAFVAKKDHRLVYFVKN